MSCNNDDNDDTPTSPAGSSRPTASAKCDEQQVAGGDTPETREIDMGTKSGNFDFEYDTYTIKDQMIIKYEGKVLFDTGCVGASGTKTISYSGKSTKITVEVHPNCAGETDTAWEFTTKCPTQYYVTFSARKPGTGGQIWPPRFADFGHAYVRFEKYVFQGGQLVRDEETLYGFIPTVDPGLCYDVSGTITSDQDVAAADISFQVPVTRETYDTALQQKDSWGNTYNLCTKNCAGFVEFMARNIGLNNPGYRQGDPAKQIMPEFPYNYVSRLSNAN